MAYIYKITNDINDRVYIGKTTRTIDDRFEEHCKDRNRRTFEKRPLYDAMNKYGVEHFHIELIEECSPDDSNEREQYWIRQYNSYRNGYNATKGGDGKILYDYEKIKNLFICGKSLRHIAKIIGCDTNTCHNALISLGFDPSVFLAMSNRKGHHKIAKIDKKTGAMIDVFDSMASAARSVGAKRNTGISNAFIRGSNEAYGFRWEIIDPALLYS